MQSQSDIFECIWRYCSGFSILLNKSPSSAAEEILGAKKAHKEKEEKHEGKTIEDIVDEDGPQIKEKGAMVAISYQLMEGFENLDIEGEDSKGRKYWVSLKRPVHDSGRKVEFRYESNENSERYEISYASQNLEYAERVELNKQDFTGRVDKSITVFPKSQMGGILGYTYLGENFMALREDHAGFMRLNPLTQVHEAIHTPDEYETRILSEWMMAMERPKYKK